MNKFEKLIEYIINDEDQKARELFHTIVVEKSRDIYESIMDEESMEETVSGREVEDLDREISDEEAHMEADEEGEEEFSLNPDGEDDDEMTGDMPAEVGHDEEAEDDKIMNIDAKLDELLAKFDEIMGDTGSDEMGAEEPSMDDMGSEEEPQMFEGENPFAKSGKSGKSGSDKSATSAKSGKSGSATSAKSGKSGKPFEGKQSSSELMREYVDRIGDIYGGAGDAAEGDAVAATGKKTSVNTKSTTGPGADFGGNVVKRTGADNANPDGTSAPSADKPQVNDAGNVNVPGGKAALAKGPSAKTGEESAVNDTPVQKQNTGKK
jgi:hypothetical protein